MKNIFKNSLEIFTIAIFLALTSCSGRVKNFMKSNVTIADLKARQSVFADSLITLHNIQVKSCESVWKYSIGTITDESGEKILLLSDKPFRSGEMTDVSGRMMVVFQKETESCLVFIDKELKPMNDLIQLVKLRVGLLR